MSLERQHPAATASRPEAAAIKMHSEAFHPENHNLHNASMHHDDSKRTEHFPPAKVSAGGFDFLPSHQPGEKGGQTSGQASPERKPSDTVTNNPDGSTMTVSKDKNGDVVGQTKLNKDGSGWSDISDDKGLHRSNWNADRTQTTTTDYDKKGKELLRTDTDRDTDGNRKSETITQPDGRSSKKDFLKDGTTVQTDKDASGTLKGIETINPDKSGNSESFNLSGTPNTIHTWDAGGMSGTLTKYENGKAASTEVYQELPVR